MKSLNFPTVLTLIRLVFSPLVLPILLVYGLRHNPVLLAQPLAVLFALLCLTDFFDGYLARRYGQVTRLGALLDPMADKLLLLSTLVALLVLKKIFFYWVIVFIGREFFVLGLRLAALERGFTVPVDWSGKLKTCMQSCYMALVVYTSGVNAPLLLQIQEGALYASLLLTLLSAVHYYRAFTRGSCSVSPLVGKSEDLHALL